MVSMAQAYWLIRRRKSRPVQQVADADLENAVSDVNLYGKYKGKLVFNLDDYVTYVAQGEAPTDPWRPHNASDDSEDVTPVES